MVKKKKEKRKKKERNEDKDIEHGQNAITRNGITIILIVISV